MLYSIILSVLLLSLPIKPPVVGGDDVREGEYPFLASLVHSDYSSARDGHFCGGTLIYPRWVLTAAHCLENDYPIDVVLSRTNLINFGGERIEVDRYFPHPDYDDIALQNDIALIRLKYSADTYPIKGILPIGDESNYIGDGDIVTVAGWGNRSVDGEDYPNIMQEVDLPVVSSRDCSIATSVLETMLLDHVCVGLEQGGKSGCFGDSGGPLIVNKLGFEYVVGVASYVAPETCGKYTVYQKAAPYFDWIDNIVSSNGGKGSYPNSACWDKNGDSICQEDEDTNSDGDCDKDDCDDDMPGRECSFGIAYKFSHFYLFLIVMISIIFLRYFRNREE